jgi:CRISPR-associated endonuclease/helicase Cas3
MVLLAPLLFRSGAAQSERAPPETLLKEMLTRKGGPGKEDLGLTMALKRLGVLQDARSGGYSSVLVLIVSSPVIETGNDLDFDFAIGGL